MAAKKSINKSPVALVPKGKTSLWADYWEAVFDDGMIGDRFGRWEPSVVEKERILQLIEDAEAYLKKQLHEFQQAREILQRK